MKTVNVELFSINELSENAKKKAIEKYRSNCNVELDSTVEYIEEILVCLGFESSEVNYSGFCSQGDGLSFTCDNWQYKKEMLKRLTQLTGNKGVLEWARCLYKESKDSFFKLSFCVERISNRYCHFNTVIISDNQYRDYQLSDKQIDQLEHIKNGLCRVFYRMLEADYYYQISDEYIIESLLSNEVSFLESGKIWGV